MPRTADPYGLDTYYDFDFVGPLRSDEHRLPPVFKRYEKPRYQEHDELIARLVDEFNSNKKEYCGCTDEQEGKIPNITPALVKSWMIQESGGGRLEDLDRWNVDPTTINHPGDYSQVKSELGLQKYDRPNKGDLETNIKAALAFLCRKGFGKSGMPARKRESGFFDSWKEAFHRYGPGTKTYSDKIFRRAESIDTYEPIEKKRGNNQ